MGKIVERKKKKKGRPSLLDLQKRSLKEQQQQQLLLLRENQRQENRKFLNDLDNSNSALSSLINYKSGASTPLRRSSRRHLSQSDGDNYGDGSWGEPEEDGEEADGEDGDVLEEDEDEGEGNGGRREKKFKFVLKLPQNENSEQNLGLNVSSSIGEEDADASSRRKRNIEAVGDGSEFKVERSTSVANDVQEQELPTPLPDKKLLMFILDRLQKKDTYGVFSEPVDPEELPDYHEVIEHPMDFGTIRKKLSDGFYANMEQFERDVFLICSNAMHYNAPDTVYFRQARSIQELAKKDFENLRQHSDDEEPEPKVVRRGRPPTKNLKKAIQRLSLDRGRSELCSDATLATATEKTMIPNCDARKVPNSVSDSMGKFRPSRNEFYLLNEFKSERNDEGSGSLFKNMKYTKRSGPLDENRRSSYNQFCEPSGYRDSSVLTTFDVERKQLMAVGLMSEHGYARSLARFAASIGAVAWKVASSKIEGSLPSGVEFGPGWVGENDLPSSKQLFPFSPTPAQMSVMCPSSLLSDHSRNSIAIDEWHTPEKQVSRTIVDVAENQNSPAFLAASSSHPGLVKTENQPQRCEAVGAPNCNVDGINSRPSLSARQTSVWRPGMNGLNGTYEYNSRPDFGTVRGARHFSFGSHQSEPSDSISRTSVDVPHKKSGGEIKEASVLRLHPHSSWQPRRALDRELTQLKKVDSVPPDLNVRFQSQVSPSSALADPTQPDLALQL